MLEIDGKRCMRDVMDLVFTKMSGAGNDFVVADNRRGGVSLDKAQIARICDRHRGVGADGLLLVEPSAGSADFRMRYYNADGGEAEMCGNGARCFARYALRLPGAPVRNRLSFETPAGVIHAEVAGDEVALAMGDPDDRRGPLSLDLEGSRYSVHFLNTGVPHAVVFVEDAAEVNVPVLGSALRYHPEFQPRGTNANFAQVTAPGELVLRTYERGVEGETLACGTGVCAAALLHADLAGLDGPVRVKVRGGDTLTVSFRREAPAFRSVILQGPADFVFEGRISL